MDFTKHTTNKVNTPQTKKVPGVKKQIINNAGGVSFQISEWDYMKRFLILGTEGGTYYVSESKLTVDACENVQKCIDIDGKKAVDMIVEVSVAGRASNNDAAIFALALAASCDSKETRSYALSKLSSVCRIGTHLFHFMKFSKTMRGTGRGLREALANWYTEKQPTDLAYQMLKYQNRDGWAHGDILRLSHPTPTSEEMNQLFAYATGHAEEIPEVSPYAKGAKLIKTKASEAPEIIRHFKLTREVIPTELMNNVDVWEAMLENMPITALVRNLGKMASLDMHLAQRGSRKLTIEKLTDSIAIQKSRIHPLTLLNAMEVYRKGEGIKGSLKWTPSATILDAIEDAFYMSFGNVENSGKRSMLALDVSGSMTQYRISGGLIDCRTAAACLSMVSMKVETDPIIVGFTASGSNSKNYCGQSWRDSYVSELEISNRKQLRDVCSYMDKLDFGATDCAAPMDYCMDNNIDVDIISIYTDNETWAGRKHPWQALDQLQQKLGHVVKCVVVAMTGTNVSIARPEYKNMLDVVGFDTNTPQAIAEFAKL